MVKSRSFKLAVIVTVVVMSAAGGVWAERSARPGAAGLMGSIPADSLICVRINKMEDSLGAVNEYLEGIAPESIDAKAMVFSKLGKLLGDERLRGVNRNGNAALFAVMVPPQGAGGETANQNPMANMFMGALLPVRNYDNFISRNPNCGQPDDEGISTITVDGRPQGLATRFRRYALLCPPHLREKLPQVKKMMAQRKRSLVSSLDDNETKLTAASSVWLYLNVKQGAPLIKPMVFGKLEQLKKAVASGQAPMMIDPSGVIAFYGDLLKMVLEGTDCVAIGTWPTPEACKVNFSLKPIDGTEMAEIVGQEIDGSFDNMLGYLEDGAMMNIACKVDHKSLNAAYIKLFDLMGKMIPNGISESDLQKVKDLTTKTINALGDSLAITGGVDTEGTGPFQAKYVIGIKDKAALEQAIEEGMQLMNEGAFNKLYKGFGMDMNFQVNRGVETYEGVSIDAAKLSFKIGEDNAPQSQALKRMFGDGLEYRMAFVKDYYVYTIGNDADKTIRELIDQVLAGGPKQTGTEIKAALNEITDSEQADAVGTFNVVRYFQMIAAFLSSMTGSGNTDIPKLESATNSNIAFAGRTVDDKLTLEIVLPKAHLIEIKSGLATFIPQIEKQAKAQQQKQQ